MAARSCSALSAVTATRSSAASREPQQNTAHCQQLRASIVVATSVDTKDAQDKEFNGDKLAASNDTGCSNGDAPAMVMATMGTAGGGLCMDLSLTFKPVPVTWNLDFQR